jgi:thiosulfate/3-mercaptopyruvate sulfurtransferase
VTGYTHHEGLVSTELVANHLGDPNVRIVEVDVDTKAYSEGHVPGAIGWAWNTQRAIRFAATLYRNRRWNNCYRHRG